MQWMKLPLIMSPDGKAPGILSSAVERIEKISDGEYLVFTRSQSIYRLSVVGAVDRGVLETLLEPERQESPSIPQQQANIGSRMERVLSLFRNLFGGKKRHQ